MLIGRKKEISILLDSYNLSESSFIAIYGRRRVAKTYLVRNVFDNKFFSHAGIYNGTYKQQLDAFANSLQDYGLTNFTRPNN